MGRLINVVINVVIIAGFMTTASVFLLLLGVETDRNYWIWAGIAVFLMATVTWTTMLLVLAFLLGRDIIRTIRGSSKPLKILNNGEPTVDEC